MFVDWLHTEKKACSVTSSLSFSIAAICSSPGSAVNTVSIWAWISGNASMPGFGLYHCGFAIWRSTVATGLPSIAMTATNMGYSGATDMYCMKSVSLKVTPMPSSPKVCSMIACHGWNGGAIGMVTSKPSA